MALTTAEEFLEGMSGRHGTADPFEVPGLGTVYLRHCSIGEVKLAGIFDIKKGQNDQGIIRTLIMAVADEGGTPILTKKNAERLADADFGFALQIVQEINRMNGLGENEVEAAVEDFGQAQDDGSSSE